MKTSQTLQYPFPLSSKNCHSSTKITKCECEGDDRTDDESFDRINDNERNYSVTNDINNITNKNDNNDTKSSKRGLDIALLVKASSLISTLAIALFSSANSITVGSDRSHANPFINQNQVSLRGIPSSFPSSFTDGATTSFWSMVKFTAEERMLQEIGDDDNGTDISDIATVEPFNSSSSSCACSLEYCQDSFVADDLCPHTSLIDSLHLGVQLLILIILLSFSALFSGLTLGLMSLDITGLEIVMAGDDEDAAKYAKIIYPVRKDGNLLLCTLLLGNVAVNSMMSIFTAEIFSGLTGFLLSTFLIVIFGEIIPQAFCSRYALRIGAATVPLVKVIRILLFVIAWPLAKALDLMLGRELATTYSSAEMIELLKVHVKENVIDQEAANAMTGALTYKNVSVKEAMTAMEQTFMLGVDEKLSFETIGIIFKTGYSRIPIFEFSRNNVIGILFVKDLIFLDPEDNVPVRSFIQIFGRNVHLVWPDDTLGDVLTELKKGKSHLAVVRDVNNQEESKDPFYEVKGIITLEDIVERIIGDSIVDETDAYADSNQQVKVERDDFEWARLRLLDTKIVDEMLTTSEISAVTAHLKTNHEKVFGLLSDLQLTSLVSSTPVTTFATATHDLDKELPNELLYENGSQSNLFTLILSGKVTILVGSENFRSDITSWSVLGGGALQSKDWIPDYSAFVSDGPCRCIQIDRDSFVQSSDASVFERRVTETQLDKASFPLGSIRGDAGNAPSVSSSKDGLVPNRRQSVFERLFHSERGMTVDDSAIENKNEKPIVVNSERGKTKNLLL